MGCTSGDGNSCDVGEIACVGCQCVGLWDGGTPSEVTRSSSEDGMRSVIGSAVATSMGSDGEMRAWSVGSSVAYVGMERSKGNQETESDIRVALVEGQ